MLAFPMRDADGWTPDSRRPVPLSAMTVDRGRLITCSARTRLAAGGNWGRKIHGDSPHAGSPRELDVTIIC